jgi:hypothetical protein
LLFFSRKYSIAQQWFFVVDMEISSKPVFGMLSSSLSDQLECDNGDPWHTALPAGFLTLLDPVVWHTALPAGFLTLFYPVVWHTALPAGPFNTVRSSNVAYSPSCWHLTLLDPVVWHTTLPRSHPAGFLTLLDPLEWHTTLPAGFLTL